MVIQFPYAISKDSQNMLKATLVKVQSAATELTQIERQIWTLLSTTNEKESSDSFLLALHLSGNMLKTVSDKCQEAADATDKLVNSIELKA